MSTKQAINIRRTTTCRICKKRLPIQLGLGRKRSYCSHACKIRAYRLRKRPAQNRKRRLLPHVEGSSSAECKVCQRHLCIPKTGRRPRYCSDTCRKKAYRKRQFRLREKYQHMARNSMKNFRSTTSIEWFTPIEYLVAVKSVLGEIDLDPASSAVANENVGAKCYFDKETDGLVKSWVASTLFLNPPHDRQNPIMPWIDKLLEEYHAGNVQEAILLVDASTETQWFSVLYDYPMCFVRGRINFVNGAGHKTSGQIQGSVFVYFGHQQQTFCRVFGRLGRISLAVNISSHT